MNHNLSRLNRQRLCCTNHGLSTLRLSPDGLILWLCDGYAKSGVAVEHRDPEVEFSDLLVEFSVCRCHKSGSKPLRLMTKYDTLIGVVALLEFSETRAAFSRFFFREIPSIASSKGFIYMTSQTRKGLIMKKINTDDMSVAEIEKLIKQLSDAKEKSEKQQEDKAKAKDQIDEILNKFELSISDVYPHLGTTSSKGSKTALPAKYRHPESGKTWTGRGRKPSWFNEFVEKGGDPKDLQV